MLSCMLWIFSFGNNLSGRKTRMVINELEFEQVYNQFRPPIYRYLIRLIGNKDAEDLIQDVFFKISKALASFNN